MKLKLGKTTYAFQVVLRSGGVSEMFNFNIALRRTKRTVYHGLLVVGGEKMASKG